MKPSTPVAYQPPPSTGNAWADACFTLDSPLFPDDRIGYRMEGLKDVPGLVKQGLYDQARDILEKYHTLYPDLDFIYAFKAFILQKNGQSTEARKLLREGLTRGRTKFLLYERLGFLCFDGGDLREAVQWWIKSVVAMVVCRQMVLWEPFLYLACVADALGCGDRARVFRTWVAGISPHKDLRLSETAADRLNRAAADLPVPSVIAALDALSGYFLELPAEEAKPPLKDPDQPEFLRGRIGGEPIPVPPPDPEPAIRSRSDFRPVAVALVVLTLILVAAVLLFFLLPLNTGHPARESARNEMSHPPPTADPDPSLLMPSVDRQPEPTPEPLPPPLSDTQPVPIEHKKKLFFLKSKPDKPITAP